MNVDGMRAAVEPVPDDVEEVQQWVVVFIEVRIKQESVLAVLSGLGDCQLEIGLRCS